MLKSGLLFRVGDLDVQVVSNSSSFESDYLYLGSVSIRPVIGGETGKAGNVGPSDVWKGDVGRWIGEARGDDVLSPWALVTPVW
jgi:hypothetical protein